MLRSGCGCELVVGTWEGPAHWGLVQLVSVCLSDRDR